DMVNLLALCEVITRHFSGAMYPTISLIYPYMQLLKQKFAPTGNNTINDYMNLIYGPEDIDTTDKTDNSTNSNIEDSDA
ncbi:19504_t:CDS:1, partial [Cetraspora pellucida]